MGFQNRNVKRKNPWVEVSSYIRNNRHAGMRVYMPTRKSLGNSAFTCWNGAKLPKIFEKRFEKPLDLFADLLYNVSVVCLGMKW